jgi:hypothetical protein
MSGYFPPISHLILIVVPSIFNQVKVIQQMLISRFLLRLLIPHTCFGFQVPSSGGYNFLIYKLLQCVCISGRRGLLFPWCGQLLRNAHFETCRGINKRNKNTAFEHLLDIFHTLRLIVAARICTLTSSPEQ